MREYKAYSTESRSILTLLGFGGVLDFAKRAAINHITAAELIGTTVTARGKHPAPIARAWSTVKDAYLDRRIALNAAQRRHVLDWMKRWRQRLLSVSVIEQAEQKKRSAYEERRRQRRKKLRMKSMEATLELP